MLIPSENAIDGGIAGAIGGIIVFKILFDDDELSAVDEFWGRLGDVSFRESEMERPWLGRGEDWDDFGGDGGGVVAAFGGFGEEHGWGVEGEMIGERVFFEKMIWFKS